MDLENILTLAFVCARTGIFTDFGKLLAYVEETYFFFL